MNKISNSAIWSMSAVVVILTIVGTAAGISYFLKEPYNSGFLEYRTIVGMHSALGAVYLILAPMQFLHRLRSNSPSYHRNAGRLLISIGLIIGISAIFMGLIIPFSGTPERVVISIFGFFFVFSLLHGYISIRNRNVNKHREWMIRAFSIGLSIATMRLIFIPWLLIIGADDATAETLSIYSFSIAFLIHTVGAELWIHRTRETFRARALQE